MSRLAVFCFGFASVLPLIAAPVPKDNRKEPVLYFPIKVGTKWVYENSDKSERIDTITAVKMKGKAEEQTWVVTVSRAEEKTKPEEKKWEVSERGVFTLTGVDEEKTARCLLKLPHRPGDEWELPPGGRMGLRLVALKPERVKLPAGEFDAIGVSVYLDEDLLVTRWSAPGVGLVKLTNGEKVILSLKSFTPGKD